MTRWNVVTVFFLGVNGERRDVHLVADTVNIVTGASGTGKSTLIKAIDYCLGSSKCELPAHVRRRCVAVGVKWAAGDDELIVGRMVPPVGQDTSGRMFASSGRSLALPAGVETFEGATTLDAAKAFLERAFGIGDLAGEPDDYGNVRGRATVRHITPYLFVTKEVIYSETVLLHGLEKADHARDIVATMPYFLRATDDTTAVDEQRLRQLQRALEREETRARIRAAADSAFKERALSLLAEAHRIGLAPAPAMDAAEDVLLADLRAVSSTEMVASNYPSENELGALHAQRRTILSSLAASRRESQATKAAIRDAAGFDEAVGRQREKLMLAEHLHLDQVALACPVCSTPSERGQETAKALRATLADVRAESAAVARAKPKLAEHERVLDQASSALNGDLRRVDDQIRTWLRQNDETKRLADVAQFRAHFLGRVSFFLETSNEPRQPTRDLNVLRAEIADLEGRIDREARATKLRRAEARISSYASEAFAQLPTVAPCIGSELDFSTRPPEVHVIEATGGAVLRLPDVGSDQNYLAIHIALSFALQRHFEVAKSPVPGLLVLDQVSRPYFPTSGEHDEREIEGLEEDEDVRAMRAHIDFLFSEAARRPGLQVLLIEHAYFADDPRYVAATRERWTRASGRALIPLDWPTRPDA